MSRLQPGLRPGRRQLLTSALGLYAYGLGGCPRALALPAAPAPSCGQKGRVRFDKDTTLSDASGRKLARFSGGESAVTLLAPPADGSDVARIETGTGRGSLPIQSFVQNNELSLFNRFSGAAGSRALLLGGGPPPVM